MTIFSSDPLTGHTERLSWIIAVHFLAKRHARTFLSIASTSDYPLDLDAPRVERLFVLQHSLRSRRIGSYDSFDVGQRSNRDLGMVGGCLWCQRWTAQQENCTSDRRDVTVGCYLNICLKGADKRTSSFPFKNKYAASEQKKMWKRDHQ